MRGSFWVFVGLAATLLCLPRPAQAQLRRDWSNVPTTADFEAALPSAGFDDRPTAHAICNGDTAGALAGCVIIDEEPSGQGVGEALIRMAPSFRLKPASASCVTRFPRTLIHSMWSDRAPDLVLKRAPTIEDVRKFYPRSGAGPTAQGFAMARCIVAASGKVDECRVIYEEPKEAGFGAVALKVAKKHTFDKPQSYDPANPPTFTMPINIVANPDAARRCGVW
ncbi:energy transducer TonB [Phenylobacterium sp. J426]|uniref:energy transducer TonB family protein n=1 Tax=Phenylobacterium sp. J426 TaxID=2898439 RepID=UPI0021515681|nr:energy transducer TonB [Phenylobacterium sp. J426]MCR5872880.1 energy transducer TonB [Phenylobacterium sp. J426]